MWKYSPVKFANFVYFCIAHAKALTLCGNVVTLFPRNTKVYKIRKLYITVYDILQYFTTKLNNFTKSRKLLPTVLKLFSNLEVCLIGKWSIRVSKSVRYLSCYHNAFLTHSITLFHKTRHNKIEISLKFLSSFNSYTAV